VATFDYAAFHLALCLAKKAPALELIVREGGARHGAGWSAFFVFAALATPSNDAWVRTLGGLEAAPPVGLCPGGAHDGALAADGVRARRVIHAAALVAVGSVLRMRPRR
jgi:hypothetical protein